MIRKSQRQIWAFGRLALFCDKFSGLVYVVVMGEPVFFRVSGGPVFGLPVLGRSGLLFTGPWAVRSFFYQSSSGPNLNSTYSQGVKLS